MGSQYQALWEGSRRSLPWTPLLLVQCALALAEWHATTLDWGIVRCTGLLQLQEAHLQQVMMHPVAADKSIELRSQWRWVLQGKQYKYKVS